MVGAFMPAHLNLLAGVLAACDGLVRTGKSSGRSPSPPVQLMSRISAASAILAGGAIAGACDITYAIVFSWARRGTSPVRILQSVASGLLGKPAFEGGWPTAALGLFLHFFIALSAAVIFYLASRFLPILTRQALIAGALYGLAIYSVMYFVVWPFSAVPFKPPFAPLPTI